MISVIIGFKSKIKTSSKTTVGMYQLMLRNDVVDAFKYERGANEIIQTALELGLCVRSVN